MRISDWSSDVCASDLPRRRGVREARRERAAETVEGGDDLEHALFAHRRHFRSVRVAVGRAQVVHARPLPGRGVRRRGADRTSVVSGKIGSVRVDLVGRRIMKKKKYITIY